MEKQRFKLINNITALVILLISSITYILTVEPTTSFWDCGEFIASSYKLEIGHPPGNPVFQILARFFTIFASPENAAVAVNIMSALCSAFTIFFLYLTIVHIGRRLLESSKQDFTLSNAIAVLGAGVVGSLAYCFSDTFWFSAVEAEVYAMSSLFTAIVFWAMLKWEEEADKPYANRWIVLIALLMGLSIGVHLLNLLTIPALAFIYYYKKGKNFSWKNGIYVLLISVVILAVILYGIIPFLPKFAAWFDLLFVNVFGLPFNSGAAVFMILLLSACGYGIWLTLKKGKALANTILLCFTMIVIGFSVFTMIVIRSSANTPTNEYQPDNPYTLIRYLGREQYGSNPLIYGETFASPVVDLKSSSYWTPLGDKYHRAPGIGSYVFADNSRMFFPRMWNRYDQRYIDFYQSYTKGRGKTIPGAQYKIPKFSDNLTFFFDFQVNYMYWRYFMWNFAGRQNDLHGDTPGDPVSGNWESGIGFLDKARLGDQSESPDYIKNNAGKNHYYMLPLLLGLIGLFFQLGRDKRNWWVTMLLFLLTGLAIVVYLNQPPYQVRERDYAYAGSFYAFTIWIGLAVIAIADFLKKTLSKIKISPEIISSAVVAVTLLVPIQMACQNWDDHDRSNRYTARDLAYNYLMSVDENAILVTFGDNDTFPLWYLQEVEEVRTDVRITNTSLLGTDWYIDQMKNRVYTSDPLPINIGREQYLYGTNDHVLIEQRVTREVTVKEAMSIFANPKIKTRAPNGEMLDYLPSYKMKLPVNKENVLKYGIVNPADMDKVPDYIEISIPERSNMIQKHELILLDILSNYEWDRPIYFISRAGDLKVNFRDYLQFDGFVWKFVPIKSVNKYEDVSQIDALNMYDKIMNVYRWDSFSEPNMHIDYQNLYTFNAVMNLRSIFYYTAIGLERIGEKEKAIEVLDKMQHTTQRFPLNTSNFHSVNELIVVMSIDLYLSLNEEEKAYALADSFFGEIIKGIKYFSQNLHGDYLSIQDTQLNLDYALHLCEILESHDKKEKSTEYQQILTELIESLR